VPAALTASVLYFAVVPATRAVIDPDIFLHLQVGEWVAENGHVPTTDPFSQLGLEEGARWYAYSWLFGVLVYGLHRVAGLVGVMFYAVVLCGLIAGSLLALFRRFETRTPATIGLTALVILTLWPVFTVRPWLFTILFFILEFRILLQVRETGRWKPLLWLIPIFVLWANIHIQFVYGLLLILIFAVEPLVGPILRIIGSEKDAETRARERENQAAFLGLRPGTVPTGKWFAGAALMCAAACLVNPYGWRLIQVVLEYATQSAPLRGVLELTSPDFRTGSEWLAAILMTAALLAWGFRSFRSPLPILLLLVGTLLFLRMRRDVWFLTVSAGLVLAMSRLGLAATSLIPGEGEPSPRWASADPLERFGWKYRLSLAGAVVVMLGLSGHWERFDNDWHAERVARHYPEAAVEFVKGELAQPSVVRGPLFNSFDWGNYLIWSLRELPVCIDGRTNLYGSERISRNWDTWDGKPGWKENPELRRANLIIAEAGSPLNAHLLFGSDFEQVFVDSGDPPVACVYARRALPDSTLEE
jgi:hypothetical protein